VMNSFSLHSVKESSQCRVGCGSIDRLLPTWDILGQPFSGMLILAPEKKEARNRHRGADGTHSGDVI